MSLLTELLNAGWTQADNGGVENFGINVKFEESKKLEMNGSNEVVMVNSDNPNDVAITEVTILGDTRLRNYAHMGLVNLFRVADKNNNIFYWELKDIINGFNPPERNPNKDSFSFYKVLRFISLNEKLAKRNLKGHEG